MSGDRPLRLLGVATAAGAVVCTAPGRPEFASTRCVFAAVASLPALGRVRRREPAAPVTRSA
ncbi:DUF6629 family protein [Streptomyces sp. NPDC058611]|uniref:DUF6629 family protein n=1 Tax=unclassified Streptomyces TaxID=2593676 RepID=UPI003661158F